MAKANNFPLYIDHLSVRCFNCNKYLGTVAPERSGYPPRNGAWRKACPECLKFTYFDLEERKKAK